MSLFIFSALVSLPTVANQILADTASSTRIITHNKSGLTYSIPIAYRQKIAIMPHVVATSSQSWFGGILHDVNDQFPNMAMDHDQADIMFPDWGLTPEQWDQFKKLRTACVVGPDTMKRFNLHVGQQIILKGTLYPFNVTLNIVGVLTGKAPPNILYFRRDYLEEAAGRPGFVSNIWVRADKSENVPQLIAAIDEQFANSSAETQSESEAAFIGSFMRQYKHDVHAVRSARRHRRDHGRTGRGEHLRDVDSRAARRDRGDALDGISVAARFSRRCSRSHSSSD